MTALPRLRYLHWNPRDAFGAPNLIDYLPLCLNLSDLRLHKVAFSSQDLKHILLSLPGIRQLVLLHVSEILQSLEFLSQVPHLAKTLQNFVLSAKHLMTKEYVYIQHLRALETLVLDPSGLDGVTLRRMTPSDPYFDKRSWPHLNSFETTLHHYCDYF